MVADPSGQRWGIEIATPGSLNDVGMSGLRGGFLLTWPFAALRGWRVAVYRIGTSRWVGPVYREKVKDEAGATAAAQRIVEAIRSGASRPWA